MIAITEEDIVKLTNFNYRSYYKQNLQNTSVTKKGIGEIIFTGKGLGKSEHAISKHYIYILPWLKDIILEGTCDGKLYSLYKSRNDDIIGFYYIYTKIQFKNEILQVKTEISLDRQGNKFYMFSHTGLIERYLNLDLVTNNIAQGGSIKISNNIINDLLEEIKPNKFHVGDCIEITVLGNISQMKENHENKIFYHGSNYKFDSFDKSKIKENKLGLCFNFTDDYSIAYQYGDNIIKAYLDLNKPVDFNHKLTYEEDCLLCDIMGFPKISKERFEQEKFRSAETIGSLFEPFKMKPKFIEFLQAVGYDGIAIPEEHHYGVFEPEQIHIITTSAEGLSNEPIASLQENSSSSVVQLSQSSNNIINDFLEEIKSLNEKMYKNHRTNFKDFYNYVLSNKFSKKSYFELDDIIIPHDTIWHDEIQHKLSYREWQNYLDNRFNVVDECSGNKPRYNGEPKIQVVDVNGILYVAIIEYFKNKKAIITTLFTDNEKNIINWFNTKKNSAKARQKTSVTESGMLLSQSSNNIINDFLQEIKCLNTNMKQILKGDTMNEELKKIKIYPKKDVNLNLEDDNEQIEESIEVGKSYKLKGMDFGDFIKDDDKDDYEVLAVKDDTVICMNKNTKEKFFFNKDVLIDPDKPEDKYTKWSIEYKEEMAGGATAGGEAGGASFSQLGATPTNSIAMVKVNGVPTAGKSVKKKKKKIKEDDEIETINNFNHPFIYGVSIKKLNNESYEVNFVGRQKENPKDVIPIFIARGVIFDDGEWFWFPEVTDYVRNLKDEVKYWIMDEFEDFKASNKFDELANIIKQKISNEPIDEELLDSEVSEVEDVLKHIISTLELQPIEGGLGFNYSKEGNNYTHVLSYNKYNNIITVDYLIFDDNNVRFEKSWDLNSIQEADDMEEEIYSEYDSWE